MEEPNPKYLHKNKDFFILIGLGLSIRRKRNV